MDCPKCGYPRAKYVESRKKFWGGSKAVVGRDAEAPKPRTDFKAKCPKCGLEFDAQEYYNTGGVVNENLSGTETVTGESESED